MRRRVDDDRGYQAVSTHRRRLRGNFARRGCQVCQPEEVEAVEVNQRQLGEVEDAANEAAAVAAAFMFDSRKRSYVRTPYSEEWLTARQVKCTILA